MESALIITNTEKSAAFIAEFLSAHSISDIVAAYSAAQARRIILERDFDFVIINSPLSDETGENLARQTARKELSRIILLVKSEIFEAVSAVCGSEGVLTISKPINIELFSQALFLAKSMRRLPNEQAENERLIRKIEAIRLVDRAKSILISIRGMSEAEAHRYIEKQAMDTRNSKRSLSERIIRDYENSEEN